VPKTCQVARFEVERTARMYRTNVDASRVLGMGEATFTRLCHRYKIERPCDRERRKREEWSRGNRKEHHGGCDVR